TSSSISSLGAGTYTVNVSNSQGCSTSKSSTLTMPSAVSVTGTTNHPSCNGSTNGSITVSATGGTGTKTFTWNTGATGATISNLGAGTYSVTASDANGCTAVKSYTLTNPSPLQLSVT